MELSRCKWKAHKDNSRKKGCVPLTYEQYLTKLDEAGIAAEDVGNRAHNYHLARYTDKGDYTPSSCRFIPHLENLAEQKINGGTESMRQKKTGRTKENNESVARQAMKITGRTALTHPSLAARAKKAGDTMRGRTKETHAGIARTSEKNAKSFAFVDPAGVVHSGKNLEAFALANGLLANALSKLRHGRLKTYHGWRLHEGINTA